MGGSIIGGSTAVGFKGWSQLGGAQRLRAVMVGSAQLGWSRLSEIESVRVQRYSFTWCFTSTRAFEVSLLMHSVLQT